VEIRRNRGPSQRGDSKRFTGTVWIDSLATASPPSRVRVNSVHFAPGARTAWHTHPFGQVLHVMEGVGRVQERDGPVEEIRAGDTVIATPGTWHWHGAGPDTLMTHFTVYEAEEANDARWGELVSDAEYSAADRT
jgi:quercetin dioxygenase-like cupin family protein